MLLTTTSSVPGAEVTEVLGVVLGSAAAQSKGGFKLLKGSPQDQTTKLKEEALEALKEEAKEMIADAVVDVKLDFKSDANGVQCFATGTAVKLDRLPPWHLRQLQGAGVKAEGSSFPDEPESSRADRESPAVSIEAVSDEKEIAMMDFTDKLNLDRDRVENLYNAGYTSLEKLKEAEITDLKAVDGINPTIARTIKTKLSDL